MSAAELLKFQVAEDWQAAASHAFTDALANGKLQPEKMAGYLQQDYQFIEGFVRLLASAVPHAPTLSDAVPRAQFLGMVCGPENTYFLRSMEARVSGRYEIMLAVLVFAEWIYLDWATPFEDRVEDLPFWLGEWISLHSGTGFAGVVAYLRGQLDAVWDGLDVTVRAEVTETFIRTVELEHAFFDAAWVGLTVQR